MADGFAPSGESKPLPSAESAAVGSKTPPWRKWAIWIGAALLLSAAGAGGAAAYLLHWAEPLLRASLLRTLERRFHGRVELDALSVSVLKGFWVEGRGLRIWLPDSGFGSATGTRGASGSAQGLAIGDASRSQPSSQPLSQPLSQPWIRVDRLRFHTAWHWLPGEPIELSVVQVEGVQVLLPAKEDRPRVSLVGADAAGSGNGDGMLRLPALQVRRIECEQALLRIERQQEVGKPAKEPLDFEFKQVALTPDGKGGPIAFRVDLVNPKPVGQIHTQGHFGPLALALKGDAGAMPVDGEYSFDHADLSTIKGIAGMLSSTGRYAGSLRRIKIEGQTQTPDFRLERVRAGAGLPLSTRFQATVDGTNGNTALEQVDATLGHTHLVAHGQVVRAGDLMPSAKGHEIRLDVAVDRGRIEDILAIAADAEKPFLTGSLALGTSFHLPSEPPGEAIGVMERLELSGAFHLREVRFGSLAVQQKVEQLSLRGQGRPDQLHETDPTSILSQMQGHFHLAGGLLALPDLAYEVPGAKILMHGNYQLDSGALNFDGDARLDAELSAAVGGWKGLLLKPLDRYLKKNGAGTDLPIHLQGTRKEPRLGVDFNRLGRTDRTPRPPAR